MSQEAVSFRKEDHVGFATFDEEAIKREGISCVNHEFSDICTLICSDNDIRVVVIRGKGENSFRIEEDRYLESLKKQEDSGVYAPSMVETAASLKAPLLWE